MLCLPDGLVNVNVMSGTPETLEVNAIVPLANAASGLPDGARVTDNVSTTSAYISLEVCRTFDRRQGRAGVLLLANVEKLEPEIGFEGVFLEKGQNLYSQQPVWKPFVLPWQVDASEKFAHPSFDLDNLSQCVWLRRTDCTSVAHLRQQLSNDIVVVFELDGQERRANEVFQRIDDPVQELEH
jgi:hypothetical protein